MERPLQIFCCYAREDQPFLLMLKKHLSTIQRAGLIALQADIDVSPGEEWEQKISHCLNTTQMILLLISADFMASDYCYAKEMRRALERHDAGEARVIPIILRPTSWHGAPFGKLQILPANAEPVSSKYWHTLDDAFFDVTKAIEKAAGELLSGSSGEISTVQPTHVMLKELQKSSIFAQNTTEQLPGQKASASLPTGTLLYTYRYQADRGTGAAQGVAWSPDGKRIASIAQKFDTTVQVWNAFDGKEVYTCRKDPGLIHMLAWSPNGKYIASAIGDFKNGNRKNPFGAVHVWNALDGRHLHTYPGHSTMVGAIAWSPDSRRIASGGLNGGVQIWNALDGTHIYSYTAHRGYGTNAVAWSPDGTRIASASTDRTVQIWQAP